jgi:hypothetical protein
VTLIIEAQGRVSYKLLPQSHSLGMNYSLFIMMLNEMVPMEAKGQPGADSAVSPLLSLQFADPYCVFHVSPLPLARCTGGPFYSLF